MSEGFSSCWISVALLGVVGCGDNHHAALAVPPDFAPPADGGGTDAPVDGGADGDIDAPDDDGVPTSVAQGACHGCAWRGGHAFCWGDNSFGQLGDGSRVSRPYAMPVQGLDQVVQMAVGCGSPTSSGHTCAVTSSKELWCWGANVDDQIGDESGEDQLVPKRIASLSGVTAVSLGARHSCALLENHRVFCWGDNDSLQIGDDTGIDRPAPTPATDLIDAVEISMGAFHSCARRQTGALACWGRNAYGEAGTGDQIGVVRPMPVVGIDDALQIAAGGFHTCARRASGGAWCWGYGEYGNMGNGTQPFAQLTPVEVELPWEPLEIASGQAVCARNAQGAVSCWGVRLDSRLNTVIKLSPEPITPLAPALTLGGSCSASPAKLVSCWGFNSRGQLGNGMTNNSDVPVSVVGLSW
jgi:alpha-tubulin suppressor-like RCC1 family protein